MVKSIQFKVEKGRVLVPVGLACRFGCRYCYTRRGEVGPPKVNAEEILQQFQVFAKEASFDTIQFGYDGDPFDRVERGIMMLQHLATMGKHITFSTKALLEGPTLQALADIKCHMASSGHMFIAFVTLTCWDSAHSIEPHTPTPSERIKTIVNLKRIDIPTFIAVRPILPNVVDAEYEQLVEEGIKAGSDGFILGPLYADDKGFFVRFIPPDTLKQIAGVKIIVPWSAHAPLWTRYEDKNRLRRIVNMIEEKGGRVFLSSADTVAFVSPESVTV